MTNANACAAPQDFIVRRDNLRICKVVPAAAPQTLAPEQVLLRVDEFAFTSNNVTYAAFGEAMSYWNFFPAPEGWGRIPVWGFGTVLDSSIDAIKPGERFYGYYPMSGWVLVQPERANDSGFFDGAAHRKPLHAVYNQYLRTTTDPGYDPAREAEQTLPRDTATVYVDMSGDGAVRSALHHHFADNLKYSCAVGGTHWDALAGGSGLPGPRPTLFFAPAQIKKRMADWGPAELQKRIAAAWKAFLGAVASPSKGWMKVVRGKGPAQVERVYLDMLDGRAKPDEGHVLAL